MSGKSIDSTQLIVNQHKIRHLRSNGRRGGILDDLPIRRKTKIEQDFLELWDLDNSRDC